MMTQQTDHFQKHSDSRPWPLKKIQEEEEV